MIGTDSRLKLELDVVEIDIQTGNRNGIEKDRNEPVKKLGMKLTLGLAWKLGLEIGIRLRNMQ